MVEAVRRQSSNLAGGAKALAQRAHRPDYMLVMLVGLVMMLGLIVMYAIGPQRAQMLNATFNTDFYSGTYFFVKQTFALVAAVGALIFFTFVPLRVVKQNASRLLLLGLAACLLLFIFGNVLHIEQIAQCSLGACRWFDLGPLGFQPSELLKFGLLIFVARFLADKIKLGQINSWEETLVPLILLTGLALLFVVVIQKDLGTGIAIVAILASMLAVGGLQGRLGAILLAGMVVLGLLAIISAPHRVERVMTFLQGDSASTESARDDGYHIKQAKIAIGTGGLLGVGVGNSVQATGYLPEAINDSVFAIIGETFGFVGASLLLVLLLVILLKILKISDKLSDPWLQLLVAGVFGWMAAHVVLNIASMTGVFPLTGITLPLLSFGGTSMVFVAGAIGMVFQASRFTSHQNLSRKEAYAGTHSRRGIGRPRHANRRRSKRA